MNNRLLRCSLFLALIGSPILPVSAEAAESAKVNQQPQRDLATVVDAAVRAEMATQQAVGVAVGVIRDGKIVYLQGYGLADRERNLPVTTQTVFNWASNSKPVGAVLAMQLVDAGKLDLDADVRTYVPEFPDKGSTITCRGLLCHQSGIPHYKNGKVIATPKQYDAELPFVDPIASLDKFQDSPLIFTPGEKFAYTTHGYILLSAAIQRAGGEPLAEQLRRKIVEPLGLKSVELDVPYNGQKLWAAGYKKRGEEIVVTPEEAHYWKLTGGGMKSNVADFARWAQALLATELLPEASKQQLWQPQPTSDGKATEYGLGFRIGKRHGRLLVGHNGGQDEVKTRLVLDPERNNALVVMCNCDFVNIGQMEQAISNAIDKPAN